MKRASLVWLSLLTIMTGGVVLALEFQQKPTEHHHGLGFNRKTRPHFNHAPITPAKFESPQAVTKFCLDCHPDSAEVASTPHFQWLGQEVEVEGHPGKTRIGKKNLLNNFCISTIGNEVSCTKCHAGYGWVDAKFDFTKVENIDCLVCHDHSNTYLKGPGGLPLPSSDLAVSARSVGTPSRENCLTCHAFGGGGEAVKHGDIDSSLNHPFEDEDVHMGRHSFLCVDCHTAPGHAIRGRAFSVSVEGTHGVECTDCHTKPEHHDERINGHLAAVACQTCHIPSFAGRIPTKATWDWSKAGDPSRADDAHSYLKIKGEFTYQQDARPEYRWFNRSTRRYLLGDKIDPEKTTDLNLPNGSIDDKNARIWPFKVHYAKQPYDVVHKYLFAPVTGGEGGYWTTFDWDKSFKLGAEKSGLAFSGEYGFAPTRMYWPLTHMVAVKERALDCIECHGDTGRMNWTELGYTNDPIRGGGRP